MEVVTRKLTQAQGNVTRMVTSLHRDTVNSSNSIRRRVDRAPVEVIRRLKEASDRKARILQQNVCDAACGAAEET